MSKIVRYLFAALGGIGIGTVAPASADVPESLDALGASDIDYCPIDTTPAAEREILESAAEQACEQALQTNTIQALEDYLYTYDCGPAACRARIVNALERFSPIERTAEVPPINGGYGA